MIRKVSKKQAKRLTEYTVLRTKFLVEKNMTCERCGKVDPEIQLHHRRGRIGNNLLDVSTFMAVCYECHRWIELHPEESKLAGFSLSRLAV